MTDPERERLVAAVEEASRASLTVDIRHDHDWREAMQRYGKAIAALSAYDKEHSDA